VGGQTSCGDEVWSGREFEEREMEFSFFSLTTSAARSDHERDGRSPRLVTTLLQESSVRIKHRGDRDPDVLISPDDQRESDLVTSHTGPLSYVPSTTRPSASAVKHWQSHFRLCN
jgi:hypothetical protein